MVSGDTKKIKSTRMGESDELDKLSLPVTLFDLILSRIRLDIECVVELSFFDHCINLANGLSLNCEERDVKLERN